MKKMLIVLAVLCLCSLANAGEINFLFGDKYAEANLKIVRSGQLSGGFTGAIEFGTVQSQPLKNFQVDFGRNFVGAFAKLDLVKEGPVVPYLAYKPQLMGGSIDRVFHVASAGVTYYANKKFGMTAEAQWCHQRNDRTWENVRVFLGPVVRF